MDGKKIKRYCEPEALAEVFGCQMVDLNDIKYFIFDFGGVMSPSSHVFKNLLELLNTDLKLNLEYADPFIKKLKRRLTSGIISSREFLQLLFMEYYYPRINEQPEGALPHKKVNIDYYLELWFNMYCKFTELSPKMKDIIQQLHNSGFTVVLLSNVYDIYAKGNILRGFYDIFDHTFLSNEIGMKKPDLEQYKYVLEKLNAVPQSCVFVDDKLKNLAPARQLGIIVVKFESLIRFKEHLNNLGIQ
ncbi:MAG: HAD-IA family hydrolase [Candidatus Lokiarchaeota archaeon]|nr:HAD-IA family hydrolase [Candidatus Lokiarchaeota archaeon]